MTVGTPPAALHIFTLLLGEDDQAWRPVNAIDTGEPGEREPVSHRQVLPVPRTDTFPEVSAEGNEWIEKVRPALARVAEMPDNWDAEGSPRTDRAIVAAVCSLLDRLQDSDLGVDRLQDSDLGVVPVPFVCPVAGGGLQLEWTSPQRHLEIELIDDQTAVYLKEEETLQGEETKSGEYPIVETERTRQLLVWFAAV